MYVDTVLLQACITLGRIVVAAIVGVDEPDNHPLQEVLCMGLSLIHSSGGSLLLSVEKGCEPGRPRNSGERRGQADWLCKLQMSAVNNDSKLTPVGTELGRQPRLPLAPLPSSPRYRWLRAGSGAMGVEEGVECVWGATRSPSGVTLWRGAN